MITRPSRLGAPIVAVAVALLTRSAAAEDAKPAAPPAAAAAPTAAVAAPAAAVAAPAAAVDDDGPPRFSLAREPDRLAWRKPGFRLQLGVVYGELVGLDGAPSGRLLGPVLRLGLRLDPRWSILASFQYVSASESGGLSGLRFAGTVDPTWHFTPSFSLAFGFGFGGIVEGRTGRMQVDPPPSTLDTSYTFPDAQTPVPRCSGVGAAALVRSDWSMVLGPRTSTGLSVEVDAQWTGCVDDTGRVEPDTGTAIVRRQFWPHVGVSLAWVISWR